MVVSSEDKPRAAAGSDRPPPTYPSRTARRRLAFDRLARWSVTAGGLGIIACILGILAFILIEIWPVTRGAEVVPGTPRRLEGSQLAALVADEYRSRLVGLSASGELQIRSWPDGELVETRPLLAAADTAAQELASPPVALAVVSVAAVPGASQLSAATTDGRVLALPVEWDVTFDEDRRQVSPRVPDPVIFQVDPAGLPVAVYAARVREGGAGTAAGLLTDGTLAVVRREARENLLTGEVTERFASYEAELPARPAVLLLDEEQRYLYAGTTGGQLVRWELGDGTVATPQVVSVSPSPVSSLALLIGDRSLVVGQADGSLSVWFPVRAADGSYALTRIRDFPPHPGSVTHLSPSMRNKGFLALGGGELGLYHSTSERTLWRAPSPLPQAGALLLAPRGDGAFLVDGPRVVAIGIDNPHPEMTWKSLFGKVWYESYERPEYVWQSTGGSDDFEPKLSLTPLLVGTLKGTFYSLLLAIPLGVLGAMYTSQFMHPRYQRFVKPTVEIMAALPTVVLGFLAGLWLAPKLEAAFPALLMMALVLPLMVLAAGWSWQRVPRRVRGRFAAGIEGILFIVVVAGGIWLCLETSAYVELMVFDGSFPAWLREATGMTYDQRNAVVVGLAMGFAVIPIIFAISEDAFSNVPQNLVSGSLALGANRWQTVTRVVLPTASPGIFSAVMIGFGRAVGETMIVLMATGNTPIMDWSPFNGFRTLSANIAVEIPEAPVGGTLYRALFLAALVLFALTFLVNTAAELVRQRLRERYSRL